MKSWIVLLLMGWAGIALAKDSAPTGEVWSDVAPASQTFLAAVTAFTEEPSEESYALATNAWDDLHKAWEAVAPDYDDDPHQRNWTRWFASTRIADEDLESLITASRCPVPFSKDMIGLLSADMQGIHTSHYLLTHHPQGEDGPDAMIDLFRNQPRRCAYLRSITEMLVEKIAALRAEG